jgi:hypothetical protein
MASNLQRVTVTDWGYPDDPAKPPKRGWYALSDLNNTFDYCRFVGDENNKKWSCKLALNPTAEYNFLFPDNNTVSPYFSLIFNSTIPGIAKFEAPVIPGSSTSTPTPTTTTPATSNKFHTWEVKPDLSKYPAGTIRVPGGQAQNYPCRSFRYGTILGRYYEPHNKCYAEYGGGEMGFDKPELLITNKNYTWKSNAAENEKIYAGYDQNNSKRLAVCQGFVANQWLEGKSLEGSNGCLVGYNGGAHPREGTQARFLVLGSNDTNVGGNDFGTNEQEQFRNPNNGYLDKEKFGISTLKGQQITNLWNFPRRLNIKNIQGKLNGNIIDYLKITDETASIEFGNKQSTGTFFDTGADTNFETIHIQRAPLELLKQYPNSSGFCYIYALKNYNSDPLRYGKIDPSNYNKQNVLVFGVYYKKQDTLETYQDAIGNTLSVDNVPEPLVDEINKCLIDKRDYYVNQEYYSRCTKHLWKTAGCKTIFGEDVYETEFGDLFAKPFYKIEEKINELSTNKQDIKCAGEQEELDNNNDNDYGSGSGGGSSDGGDSDSGGSGGGDVGLNLNILEEEEKEEEEEETPIYKKTWFWIVVIICSCILCFCLFSLLGGGIYFATKKDGTIVNDE